MATTAWKTVSGDMTSSNEVGSFNYECSSIHYWQSSGDDVRVSDNTYQYLRGYSWGYYSPSAYTTRNHQYWNFGFNLSPPVNILGVEARVEVKCSDSSRAKLPSVRLLNESRTAVGDDKATGTWVPVADTIWEYGGASDLWGNALTANWVNDSNFGLEFQYRVEPNPGEDIYLYIDYVALRITYQILGPTELPLVNLWGM